MLAGQYKTRQAGRKLVSEWNVNVGVFPGEHEMSLHVLVDERLDHLLCSTNVCGKTA